MPNIAPLDPENLFVTLARAGVKYVLVGALAARMQGFPRTTADADITPDTSADNLERLVAALRTLHARIFTDNIPEGLEFDCSVEMLGRAAIWNLVTSAGRIDLVFAPAGTRGYAELIRRAILYKVFGVDLYVASLEDIIRSKEASARPQDRQDVVIMRSMIDRQSPLGY